MRAHEKMLLNSKLMKACPYGRHFEEGEGCALGMMEDPKISWANYSSPRQLAEQQFPWLGNTGTLPCDCKDRDIDSYKLAHGGKIPNKAVIVHLFNEHVCSPGRNCPTAEPWTMEKLADYIKSIDPTVDQDEEILCEPEEAYDRKEVEA